MEEKEDITITNFFFKKSNRKPNKIWVDNGSELNNRSMKSWLEDNNIEIYSTSEGKSAVARRFITALRNKSKICILIN